MSGDATRRYLAATSAAVVLGLAAPGAHAFERTWHLGGGVGAAFANRAATAPALGFHAAYGISDVFDVRLELQASRHAEERRSDARIPAFDLPGASVASLGIARLGLAYKVDVMRWIPYAGLSLGGFSLFGPNTTRLGPSAGAFGGLDYALSERLGIGLFGGADYLVLSPAQTIGFVLVRAEYRFGS